MSNENIHEPYDKEKWIYIPDKDTDYRCVLGTVGENPLFVVGINPSTAKPGELDNTMKSVSRIAEGNGFDSFIMLNVCAQRATDPNDMEKELDCALHDENLKTIEQIFQSYKNPPVIWAAWGTLINKRKYLADCLVDLVNLADRYNATWCKVGKVSKAGHPHHPLYLRSDSKIERFDIYTYISKLRNTRNSLEEKWKNDPLRFTRITNNDLVCKDCIFRFDDSEIFGNTSKCEIFPERKPDDILRGKACSEYCED